MTSWLLSIASIRHTRTAVRFQRLREYTDSRYGNSRISSLRLNNGRKEPARLVARLRRRIALRNSLLQLIGREKQLPRRGLAAMFSSPCPHDEGYKESLQGNSRQNYEISVGLFVEQVSDSLLREYSSG